MAPKELIFSRYIRVSHLSHKLYPRFELCRLCWRVFVEQENSRRLRSARVDFIRNAFLHFHYFSRSIAQSEWGLRANAKRDNAHN
jgi:hypothetical protein